MKEVVIVSAVRTPMGSWGGSLKDFSATQLGGLQAYPIASLPLR
jgi:acetyl-CoA C-acetyltransferase